MDTILKGNIYTCRNSPTMKEKYIDWGKGELKFYSFETRQDTEDRYTLAM